MRGVAAGSRGGKELRRAGLAEGRTSPATPEAPARGTGKRPAPPGGACGSRRLQYRRGYRAPEGKRPCSPAASREISPAHPQVLRAQNLKKSQRGEPLEPPLWWQLPLEHQQSACPKAGPARPFAGRAGSRPQPGLPWPGLSARRRTAPGAGRRPGGLLLITAERGGGRRWGKMGGGRRKGR